MNQINKILPKIDPFSLRVRLTIGIAAFSTLGLGSLAIWTSLKMQQILINSHKYHIEQIADRLPRAINIILSKLPIAYPVMSKFIAK